MLLIRNFPEPVKLKLKVRGRMAIAWQPDPLGRQQPYWDVDRRDGQSGCPMHAENSQLLLVSRSSITHSFESTTLLRLSTLLHICHQIAS